MKKSIRCTNLRCDAADKDPKLYIIKYGFYRRSCDSKRVQRFRCRLCKMTVSNQTFNATYRHHKPRINGPVAALLCSKVSMRQSARLLNTTYKTVARKMRFHARVARLHQEQMLKTMPAIDYVQMDEMETFEHTKCKPLSIALAVNPKTRHILAAKVAVMPAKGRLAKISRRRYGSRPDLRKPAFQEALRIVKAVSHNNATILTDKKSAYSSWIKEVMPAANHKTTKGRRGCVVGYGELKEGGYDPLFMLNHTAAMIRDNLARMLRRTWCTTKLIRGLQDALDMYVVMHNRRLGAA